METTVEKGPAHLPSPKSDSHSQLNRHLMSVSPVGEKLPWLESLKFLDRKLEYRRKLVSNNLNCQYLQADFLLPMSYTLVVNPHQMNYYRWQLTSASTSASYRIPGSRRFNCGCRAITSINIQEALIRLVYPALETISPDESFPEMSLWDYPIVNLRCPKLSSSSWKVVTSPSRATICPLESIHPHQLPTIVAAQLRRSSSVLHSGESF